MKFDSIIHNVYNAKKHKNFKQREQEENNTRMIRSYIYTTLCNNINITKKHNKEKKNKTKQTSWTLHKQNI